MLPHDGDDDGVGDGDGDDRLLAGVRFALVGFDPASESQYRSEMVRRGGADAGGHGAAGCTHVVVFGLVYDDPVCVAAREGGKKVVNELWVDDSLDAGVIADADRVLYKPVRDLDGIPGSQSLNICLTGYQKNGREDIMKMVTLMGAQFSKPLIAHKVTHLICYKFEGEKYELAKMVNINLVNHQWLEDCLKAWEILPIDNYNRSGWEQEMMEVQVQDSEDEAEDAGRGLSHSRSIARSVSVTGIRMGTHVDPDVRASVHGITVSPGNTEITEGRHLGTSEQGSEDVCIRPLDVRADIQSTHNTNGVTNSADPEAHDSILPPINSSGNEKAPGDHITRDETKDGDKRPLAASTLNTNGLTDCADHLVHQATMVSPISVINKHNIDGEYLDNPCQFTGNNVSLLTSSAESLLKKTLHSSRMSGNVNHKDDGPVADLTAKVGQANIEGTAALLKANLVSPGNSASKTTPILSYSRKRSRKSVSPGTNLNSVDQTASPQSFERNTPNVEFNISASMKSNDKISELADAKSLRDEAIKHVNRPDSVVAQTKRRLSSASPKLLNGGTDSATGTANSPFSSRGIASDAATVSDLGENSTGSRPIKANGKVNSDVIVNLTERQKSDSSRKKLLSYRRTSLKLARSSEAEKLPEIFDNETKVELPAKAKELTQHEAAAEKERAISPSIEVEKTISSFSRQDQNVAVSNASQANSIEAVATDSQHDKEVSHATMEAGARKVSTSRVKNAGAKRLRSATNGRLPSSACSKSESKSKHGIEAVLSHENVEAEKGNNCTSVNAAECGTSFPEEILRSRADTIAKNSLNANSEMNDVLAASKMEFANVISKGSNPEKLPGGTTDDQFQRGSSEKGAYAIARSAVPEVSQPADVKMADASTADKAEAVSLKSNFCDAVPQASTEKLSSTASADNHETCAPDRVPKNRVRKAVAKRKISATQQYVSGSEPCNTGGVFPSEAEVDTIKRAAECPTNAGKAMADKDVQSANKDGTANEVGSFCKGSFKDISEDAQKIKPRSSKKKKVADVMDGSTYHEKENVPSKDVENTKPRSSRKKKVADAMDGFTDHNKENVPSKDVQNTKPRSSKKKKVADVMDGSTHHEKENVPSNANLSPKSKYGTSCVSSKCITKSVRNGKDVPGDHSTREGNDCTTLALLEPTWFILSGHGLLRKDYMSILRRLKGRVCRGSHQWSFQATHFIAPELRRTEKFFAAAAAGRWILKSDYLSACNEAGKFVEEEPFEWHGDGPNNGDTISLDAPRKWRQLRQRTGHGAFHGMKIIIYGECISPSLDTLKRVVKAGDGTILATSPPYTRVLKHGASFAVVSAGVLGTDAWVQEFVSHDIPCISTDYLVEYVCKPGHPLNKHVLFNMHDLADRSLQKLERSQQGELGGAGTAEAAAGGGDPEISCSACGSSNQEGAVMLICSGSGEGSKAGCGAGMHADCLNPQPGARAALDGDWLCPKCDDGHVKAKPPPRKKAKKGGSRSGKPKRK
ncbi:BRCT domain-containing protein At4g02110-like [Triticum urartu]|nr:BRCT domain-containing protein At4g02110-like [Triticum urartu]